MPVWNSLFLFNANSPQSENILFFHDHISMILSLIVVMVFYIMMSASLNKFFNKFLLEAQQLETVWTCVPTFIIILIAFPSLTVLYMMEEVPSPFLTLKIMGHQWYWSYSFNDSKMSVFMKVQSSLDLFRLLDTNQRLVLPCLVSTRLLITSKDVIHSWSIPSLGVKSDATPGRINQTMILPYYSGVFFGQCSEICGMKHSFMPISLEIIPFKSFINWVWSK